MFDHLDDPTPPPYDSAAVRRRANRLIRRRHHLRLSGSILAAVAIAAGGAAYGLGRHKASVPVLVEPNTTLPTCTSPAAGTTALAVYNHASIHVGWLPSGYHLISGSPTPPNNDHLLDYQPVPGSGSSIKVAFDVGVSAQDPISGIRQNSAPAISIDIGGQQASAYTPFTEPATTYLEWSPRYGVLVVLEADHVDLQTLQKVGNSVAVNLGPATAITPNTYLGPVLSFPQVLTRVQQAASAASTIPIPTGRIAAKLATYAEVRAALGRSEYGGTIDTADGTPVWVIFDSLAIQKNPPNVTVPVDIVNAQTGQQIEAQQAPARSLTWIAEVPDHQHAPPCTPSTGQSATATTSPTNVAAPASSWPATNIALSGETSDLVATAGRIYAAVSTSIAGQSPPKLAAVDLATKAVTYASDLGGTLTGITYGNSLWVTVESCAAPQFTPPCHLTLQQRDPQSLSLLQTIDLGTTTGVAAIATVPGAPVWVGSGTRLIRVDPSTRAVHTFAEAPSFAWSLSIDENVRYVYTATAGTNGTVVQQLDVRTGQVLASKTLPSVDAGQVSASADGVWVSFAGGMQSHVAKLSASGLGMTVPADGDVFGGNPATNPVNIWGAPGGGPEAAVSGGALWLTLARSATSVQQVLACADPSTGTIWASDTNANGAGLQSSVVAVGGKVYAGGPGGMSVSTPSSACRQ